MSNQHKQKHQVQEHALVRDYLIVYQVIRDSWALRGTRGMTQIKIIQCWSERELTRMFRELIRKPRGTARLRAKLFGKLT